MARKLAIAKRISLNGIVEGWTDECFALMMPVSYPDMVSAENKKQDDYQDNLTWQAEFLASHFVSGKVMVYGDDGNLVLDDMTVDDLTASLEISAHLAVALTGGNVADPKDLSEAQPSTAKSSKGGRRTAPPSSTSSPSTDGTPTK